ncbi:S41 family peptidase [Pedobacter sp. MR2016-24]|uniref:S41 family peptidase n=1 Tax=Pedobacter sp. MR2016-24 TaxID=2994466 RepID=UPI0022462919|nr:S41 family peptidase [Pedobacter sp. MR2016-24]MCX2485813.1 S41 family peptidase [Pedobacter sp. MR2016-24]
MKHLIIIFFTTILFSFNLSAQNRPVKMADSVKVFIDKSLALIQANSINRDKIDWQMLKKDVYDKADGADDYAAVAAIFPYIFEHIDDHHGVLKYKDKSYYWKSNEPYLNKVVINAIKRYDTLVVKLLDKHTGYILLPGNNDFSGKNINKEAQAIRRAIAAVNTRQIRGWVLDLRLNTGGSMFQMLAGLSELIGEGKIGSFVNQHGEEDGEWILKGGNIYLDQQQVSTLPSTGLQKNELIPLAVLISGRTASSGEVVAISTIGRKRSILIGENTAGYTTANEGFKINSLAGLNLAVDYDADRNGKIYKKYISPDVLINGEDNFEDINLDMKVNQALKWLKKQQ